jgi:HAD superfamily hydrolase (TIGR01490 family)
MKVVAAFDFDGTMTTKDTFIPFLCRAFGKSKVYRAFFLLLPEACKVALGMSNRDIFKARLIGKLFPGESVKRLEDVGRQHADEIIGWLRPGVKERLLWHRSKGHRLIMVSASLGLYLKPVAASLGFDDLLCTCPASNQTVFDGQLEGKNCRGPEKAARLKELIGDLSRVEIYAYGDSAGDREMLAIAQHSHFRFFEHRPEIAEQAEQ